MTGNMSYCKESHIKGNQGIENSVPYEDEKSNARNDRSLKEQSDSTSMPYKEEDVDE